MKVVFEELYAKVVEGGFIVLDDSWTWPGCRAAVEDDIMDHKIEGVVLKRIDRHGAYFQKPLQPDRSQEARCSVSLNGFQRKR